MKVKLVVETDLKEPSDEIIAELEKLTSEKAPFREVQHTLSQKGSVSLNQVRLVDLQKEAGS